MTRRDLETASNFLTLIRLTTLALSAGVTVFTFVDDKIMNKKNGRDAKAPVQSGSDVVQMPQQTEAR